MNIKLIIKQLSELENKAVTVQALAYFSAPKENGCPKGHMGHMGHSGLTCDITSDELIQRYITSIGSLLTETEKDLNKIMEKQ